MPAMPEWLDTVALCIGYTVLACFGFVVLCLIADAVHDFGERGGRYD